MNKLVSIVATLIIGALASSGVGAATWKPFYTGAQNPSALADRVQMALDRDREGNAALDPARCERDQSACATPLYYLKMFQESWRQGERRLSSVREVPDYLRSLVVAPAPSGEYWSACLRPVRGGWNPVLHCNSRAFKPDETAWRDPDSKGLKLMSNCANPIDKQVPQDKCVYTSFDVTTREQIARFGLLGPQAVAKDDGCLGIQRAGETEFEHWWKDECPEFGCDLSPDADAVGQPVQVFGSIRLLVPGRYTLRLPAYVAEAESQYVTVICLQRRAQVDPPREPPRPVVGSDRETYARDYEVYMKWRTAYEKWRNDWLVNHSDGMAVRWNDYRTTASGKRVAIVYNTKQEAIAKTPPGMALKYIPWGEWVQQHPEALK